MEFHFPLHFPFVSVYGQASAAVPPIERIVVDLLPTGLVRLETKLAQFRPDVDDFQRDVALLPRQAGTPRGATAYQVRQVAKAIEKLESRSE